MHRLLNVILLAAIAVLGVRVYGTWTARDAPADEGSRARPRPSMDVPSTARTPPAPRLAMTIAERDLFDESRRAPTETVAESVPTPPPDVELIGVLMVGPEPEAVVKETSGSGKPRHVFKGDDVGGYTVSGIAATEVTLTSPSGEEVPLPLKLKLSSSPAAGGAARSRAAAAAQQPKESQPTAAGPQPRPATVNTRANTAASVRERLRELRQKRREQQQARTRD
jgi:hypothetical protein